MTFQIVDLAFFGRGLFEIALAIGAYWISERTGSDSISKVAIFMAIILIILGLIDISKGIVW